MKILLHSLNFAPEPIGVGKYSGEMTAFLTDEGHDVHVVTAPPYYPSWRVAPGYGACRYSVEQRDGAKVTRCPTWVPSDPTALTRLLHLGSFAASSVPPLALAVRWAPDVVLAVAPTLLAAPGALALARLTGARSWLHVQDFELDAALGLGLLGSPARHVGERFEVAVLSAFDRVSSISPAMVRALAGKGVPPDRAYLFPNWVDTQAIRPLAVASPFRAELGLDPGATVVLYSGNLGLKQGLHVLVQAAALLADVPLIQFVICGEGSARTALMRAAEEARLPHLRFLPLQPVERLNELLNLANIHVLTELRGAADQVMPSKLTGILASGRPVVATTTPRTSLGKAVCESGGGVLVPPEDPRALAAALLDLHRRAAEAERLGRNARRHAERRLERTAVLGEFCRELEQSTNGGRR